MMKWNVYCFQGLSSYKFRSSLRTATETEVLDTNNFLNTLLCAQDAWLPDWDYLPWGQTIAAAKVKAEDFVRIDLIRGT